MHSEMADQSNVPDKQVIGKMIETSSNLIFLLCYYLELSLSQVAGEYGSSREPDILTTKCQNLRMIIGKVHR